MVALQTLLMPQTLTKVVSQQAATSDWLINLFGCQPGGRNELNMGHGRFGQFNIYNNVRKVAKMRAPGTAAGRRAPNPMGTVMFSYPRMYDSVELLAEQLHNLGLITDPKQRDAAGADMIRRQTDTLGQLASNWRKAMLSVTCVTRSTSARTATMFGSLSTAANRVHSQSCKPMHNCQAATRISSTCSVWQHHQRRLGNGDDRHPRPLDADQRCFPADLRWSLARLRVRLQGLE